MLVLSRRDMMIYAFTHRPSLIIDAANIANPHAFFGEVTQEQLHDVYVWEVELLYTFRDILVRTESTAKDLGVKTIVITPFNRLFNYQNEQENDLILSQCHKIIEDLSKKFVVVMHGTHSTKSKTNYRDRIKRANTVRKSVRTDGQTDLSTSS